VNTNTKNAAQLPASASDIQSWLVTQVSEALSLPPGELRVDRSLFDLGLDSAAAVGLTDELSEWLDRPIEPTLVYDHPTIEQLAGILAQASSETCET
jgi:acyl carrier protein